MKLSIFPEKLSIIIFSEINKDNTWYAKRREDFRLRIQEIYDENHQIFGADKIAAIMKNEGIKISANMVRSLMRDMGLISIRQNAKKLYEDETRKCKNYINKQTFYTEHPRVGIKEDNHNQQDKTHRNCFGYKKTTKVRFDNKVFSN